MKFPKTSPIEVLESRIAPAGIVNIAFNDGALVLSGDQEDSSLSFHSAGDGTFVLEALDDTTLIRTDGDSNVFEGPIKSLHWIGGGGNDQLTLEGIEVDDDVTLDGGDGENHIYIGSVQAGGNLIVETKGLDDRIELNATFIDLGGDFRINNMGDGYSFLQVYESVLRIGGSFVFQGGNGSDSVYVEAQELSVDHDISVDCGNGENLAYFYLQTLEVGGNVTLLNGDHQDLTGGSLIDVPFGHIGGNLTMSEGLGDSGNALSFQHLTIDGNVTISHVGGTSDVGFGYWIEPGDTPTSKLFIGGNLNVNLGDGGRFYSYLSTLQVDGKMSIEGGSGDDTVSFVGDDLAVAKGWSIDLHDGANSTDIAVNTISIGKALTVNGGAGNDTFSVTGEALVVNKAIVATMGDGAGSISLTSSYIHVGAGMQLISGEHSGEDLTETLGSERLAVKGGIEIHNGDGTNHTVIDAIRALNVAGGLKVVGGNGDDTLSVTSNGTIKGGVLFSAYDGDNHFVIDDDDDSSRYVAVQGDLKVISVGNTEIVATGLAKVNGDVRLSLGTGTADVRITLDGALNVNGTFTILGENTSLDLITLRGLWVRGQTNLNLGDGDSQVNIDDSVFRGAFNLATGAGNDFVAIEQFDSDIKTTFRGNTRIWLGAGDDQLVIGGASEFDQAVFLMPVFVYGGDGVDAVNDIEQQNVFGPNATLTLRSV